MIVLLLIPKHLKWTERFLYSLFLLSFQISPKSMTCLKMIQKRKIFLILLTSFFFFFIFPHSILILSTLLTLFSLLSSLLSSFPLFSLFFSPLFSSFLSLYNSSFWLPPLFLLSFLPLILHFPHFSLFFYLFILSLSLCLPNLLISFLLYVPLPSSSVFRHSLPSLPKSPSLPPHVYTRLHLTPFRHRSRNRISWLYLAVRLLLP